MEYIVSVNMYSALDYLAESWLLLEIVKSK